MSKIDDDIKKRQERLTQLKNKKKAEVKREKMKKLKADTSRQIIIGKIVSKYFPEVLAFKPHPKDLDNNVEFDPLESFIAKIANDKELVARLKESSEKTPDH